MSPPRPGPEDPALAALRARVEAAEQRIERARRASPRGAAEVTLVAVTKSVPASALALVAALPRRHVGESRVKDASAKRESGPLGLVWHGIGHIQTNKARRAATTFDVVHSVDSLRLAQALDAGLEGGDRRLVIYAQVNAARDPAKGGVAPEDALAFAKALLGLPRLDLAGFMTIGREDTRGEAARPAFRTLREVRDDAVRAGLPASGLSMGMSDDFETAIDEGATIVRLGRTLWAQATDAPALDERPPGRTVSPEAR